MEIISQDDARSCGLKRFFTGIPCVHGHISERFVAGGACCYCAKERLKKNRWKYKEYSKKYKIKNRAKITKQELERRKRNPEKAREIRKRRYDRKKAELNKKSHEINKRNLEYLFHTDPDEYKKQMAIKAKRQREYMMRKRLINKGVNI